MKNLKELVEKIWDGDVSYEEATKDFLPWQINLINNMIANVRIFDNGYPEFGDNKFWDHLVDTFKPATWLDQMVSKF